VIWFTVQLPDEPGSIARLAAALADRGINITGIIGLAEDNGGVLMLSTSQPAASRDVLAALGLDFEEQAIADQLRTKPLSLPELLERGRAHAQVVRATVYALLITHFIDLNGGARAPINTRSR